MNAENGSFFEDSASTSQSLDKQAAKRRAKIKHSDGLRTGELSGRMWRLGGDSFFTKEFKSIPLLIFF